MIQPEMVTTAISKNMTKQVSKNLSQAHVLVPGP